MALITVSNVRVDIEAVRNPEGYEIPGGPRPLLWRYWK